MKSPIKSSSLFSILLLSSSIFCCSFMCPEDSITDTLNLFQTLDHKHTTSNFAYSGYFDFSSYAIRDTIPADSLHPLQIRYWNLGKFIVTQKYKGLNIPDTFVWHNSSCTRTDSMRYDCSQSSCDILFYNLFKNGSYIAFCDSINDTTAPSFFNLNPEYWCKDRLLFRNWFEIADGNINYHLDAVSIDSFLNMTNGISNYKSKPNVHAPFLSIQPNPLSSSTIIKYSANTNQKGKLSIYSIAGELVLNKTIENNGTIQWNTANLASGIYLCRLITTIGICNRKIFIIP